MNYEEAVAYAGELMKKKNIVLGLGTMKELLHRLGDPQNELSFLHIAGTNGKGSILAMVASICQAAGYLVGRYNSPSVFTYCEKIQVNGESISEADVARLMTKVREASDAMEEDGFPHPTSFETETAVSFLYFKEKKCDLVALETGMGGETDATNVVTTTQVSILASISMDHMQFLGNTLEEIAKVKGGIIKPGRPVAMTGQNPEVEAVIQGIAEEKQAPLIISRPEQAVIRSADHTGTVFDYKEFQNVKLSLLGKYQVINACTALEVVEILRGLGYDIRQQAVLEGMAGVKWPGRFQMLMDRPVFLIDGAHNPEAAVRLRDSIELYFSGRKISYIMGILADKDYEEIVRITVPLAQKIYTVTPGSPRALGAEALRDCVLKSGFTGKVKAELSVKQAVFDALLSAKEDEIIIAFGSLSYLSEVTDALKETIHDR